MTTSTMTRRTSTEGNGGRTPISGAVEMDNLQAMDRLITEEMEGVEPEFVEPQINKRNRRECILNFLDEMGLIMDEYDSDSDESSLEPGQVRPQDEIEDNQQGETEGRRSDHADELTAGLRCLSWPFQVALLPCLKYRPHMFKKALVPFLESETFREEVEQEFVELQKNKQYRQECILDFLHALGSIEKADDVWHQTAQNNTSQGSVDLPGLTLSGHDGANQGDATSQPPPPPKDQASTKEGAAIDAESVLQLQTLNEKFFDWSFHSPTLQGREDIMENCYFALLPIYNKAKVKGKGPGVSITVKGMLILFDKTLLRRDYLAFFRSLERNILLPVVPAEEIYMDCHQLEDILFDPCLSTCAYHYLISVTYSDCKYGTITMFQRFKKPGSKIRPIAAMQRVPRALLKRVELHYFLGISSDSAMRTIELSTDN